MEFNSRGPLTLPPSSFALSLLYFFILTFPRSFGFPLLLLLCLLFCIIRFWLHPSFLHSLPFSLFHSSFLRFISIIPSFFNSSLIPFSFPHSFIHFFHIVPFFFIIQLLLLSLIPLPFHSIILLFPFQFSFEYFIYPFHLPSFSFIAPFIFIHLFFIFLSPPFRLLACPPISSSFFIIFLRFFRHLLFFLPFWLIPIFS